MLAEPIDQLHADAVAARDRIRQHVAALRGDIDRRAQLLARTINERTSR